MADLASVADALYAELPARFTAERGASAKAVREEGDRDLASEIAKLPKPTVAAWAVNALVRHRAELMDGFSSLGASLREAQADLDADSLRELTRQRRALVTQLAGEAQRLGRELGQTVSNTVREDVAATLQAALADSDAAQAVATGRLVRALVPNGLDPVDLDGAVGGPAGGAPVHSAPKRKSSRDDLAEARERRERELAERTRERDTAAEAHRNARDTLDSARERRDGLQASRDESRERVADLEEQLEKAKQTLATATSKLRKATAEFDDAEDAEARTARALSRAEERLDSLTKRRR
jgi:hypothetical protein